MLLHWQQTNGTECSPLKTSHTIFDFWQRGQRWASEMVFLKFLRGNRNLTYGSPHKSICLTSLRTWVLLQLNVVLWIHVYTLSCEHRNTQSFKKNQLQEIHISKCKEAFRRQRKRIFQQDGFLNRLLQVLVIK